MFFTFYSLIRIPNKEYFLNSRENVYINCIVKRIKDCCDGGKLSLVGAKSISWPLYRKTGFSANYILIRMV